MIRQELRKKIKSAIPHGSIGRYDLLPLFANDALFSEIVKYFSGLYADKIDFIASPEAIGWILGVALARDLHIGFIPLRKGGRLPYPESGLLSSKYLDYSKTEKTLAIKKGSLDAGRRVLIVDEWIETGSSMRCCIELLEKAQCVVSGLAAIGIDYNDGTKSWIDSGFVSFIGVNM